MHSALVLMLNSWFGKGVDEKNVDSQSPPEHPPIKPDAHALASTLSTPHDEVLAELYSSDSDERRNAHPFRPTPELPGLGSRPYPFDTVYDPFDGSVLGTLTQPDRNIHPEAHVLLTDTASKNEELWTHLSKVLDLQSQIAHLHVDMEGIGTRAGEYGKGKSKGKGTPSKGGKPRWGRSDTINSVEEDEGVDVKTEADEEERQHREREGEFTRLADQFEGRREGIQEIMTKASLLYRPSASCVDPSQLDDLSKALTEFHALHEPIFEFPQSRHNSLPATSSETSPSSTLDREGVPLFSPMSSTLPNPPSRPLSGLSTPNTPGGFALNPWHPGTNTHLTESPISAPNSPLPQM